MQIEIEGCDAIKVAQDIVEMEGVQGSYEVISEVEREGTLATIATIIIKLGQWQRGVAAKISPTTCHCWKYDL